MEVHTISPILKLIDPQPPIPGYERFIGAYLVGERKAIVDPGPKSAMPNLPSALAQLDITPGEIDCIILIHIHIDHAGGVGTALRDMPRSRVLATASPCGIWSSPRDSGKRASRHWATWPASMGALSRCPKTGQPPRPT